MNLKYKILGIHGKRIPFSSGNQTELNFFSYQRKLVITKIDEIFSLPTITYVNDELIEILAKLRDCWFYSGIKSYKKFGEKVIVNNLSLGIYDYYLLFIRLKKFAEINEFKVTD